MGNFSFHITLILKFFLFYNSEINVITEPSEATKWCLYIWAWLCCCSKWVAVRRRNTFTSYWSVQFKICVYLSQPQALIATLVRIWKRYSGLLNSHPNLVGFIKSFSYISLSPFVFSHSSLSSRWPSSSSDSLSPFMPHTCMLCVENEICNRPMRTDLQCFVFHSRYLFSPPPPL